MHTMERSPRPSHHLNNPSFSSSLLDAIDRSIDESDSPVATRFHSPPPNVEYVENPAMIIKHGLSNITYNNHSHRRHLSMSTVTSNTSSFGGFSSEPESPIITYRPKAIPTTTRSENSRSTLPPPQPEKKISIRSRIRELRISGRGSLARFLGALFSGTRKAKVLSLTSGDARDDESMWSSSSCCTRSSIGRITPSGQRSGGSEFWAQKKVKIAESGGEEQESTLPSPLPVTQTKTVKFEQSDSMVENGVGDARARRRRVEEMLRRVGEMAEDGWESDSSEDLFEIENLIRVGGEGEYRDELPVFGTTNFETNRAIARGSLCN